MSYQLYIANKNYSSWSLRPWILMRELDIPFEEIIKPFSSEGNWNAFRRFSPSGKVPCLIHKGVVVWDSLAITEYLAEQHPRVWPQDKIARAWARSACAEMHSGFNALRNLCPMNIGVRIQLNQKPETLLKDLNRLTELWEQGLVQFGGPFLAGDVFSAVDAFYAPVCFRIQTYGLTLPSQVQGYVERLLALPSMKSWQQAALSEAWIEEGHERESLENGVLIEDLRR